MDQYVAKIDKDFPIPEMHGGRWSKWPWRDMKIGDSFFMPGKTIIKASREAWAAHHRINMKFACRTVTENGVKGVRIWRVS